jgi:hypothetical protein
MKRFEMHLRKLFPQAKLNQLTDMQLDGLARIMQSDIVMRTPVRTGQLLSGIRWKRMGRDRILYIEGKRNNEVASYLVYGTKPHYILPKNKEALAWIDFNTLTYYVRKKSFVKGIKAGKYFKWELSGRAINDIRNFINKFIKLYQAEQIKLEAIEQASLLSSSWYLSDYMKSKLKENELSNKPER